MKTREALRRLARAASHAIARWPRLHALAKAAFHAVPSSIRGRQMVWDSFSALAARRRKGDRVTVLQIGANDGLHDDPLRHFILRHRWAGILVEPVPFLFEKLQQAHGQREGLILENAAIADHNGRMPFYFIEDPKGELPDWALETGSFVRELVPSEIAGRNVTAYHREIEVPCLTVDSLLAKHGVSRVDVVVSDAQGYDDRIVLSLPLDRIAPEMIVYESCLLSPERRSEVEAFLGSHGYRCESDRWDTLALRHDGLATSDREFQ